MGLDMYLQAQRYVSGWHFRKDAAFEAIVKAANLEPTDRAPSITVSANVAYWRKANHIHRWFVDNVQGGVDECQEAYVDRDQLQELVDLCKQVQAEPDKAKMLLPPQAGFFFGSTEIDEEYWVDLADTVEQLERVLNDPKLADVDFFYHSSW
jgi:hypothetical protein